MHRQATTATSSYLCPVGTGAWTAGRWHKERAGRPPGPELQFPGHPPSVHSQYGGTPLRCRASSAHVRSTTPRPPPWPGSEVGTPARWRAPATLILDGPSPLCCLSALQLLATSRGYNSTETTVSQLTHWNSFIIAKTEKKLESAIGMVGYSSIISCCFFSRQQLCWSHCLQVLCDCWLFDQPEAASVLLCLVLFEVADVDGDDGDDEIFSCLSPPQPTTADQQQADRRCSLKKTRSRNILINKWELFISS